MKILRNYKCILYRGSRKNDTVFFASKLSVRRFYQNVQKFINTIKTEEKLDIAFKYSLFSSKYLLFKNTSTGIASILRQNHARSMVCNNHDDATELTEVMLNVPIMRMNDRHQSFESLVSGIIG